MGGKGELYLSLRCHRQTDSCIKMASDESDFNVSLMVKAKVTNETVSVISAFKDKGRRAVAAYRTDVRPLI